MKLRVQVGLLCLSGLLFAAPAAVWAQHGGGMGGGGMGGGMGMPRERGMGMPGAGRGIGSEPMSVPRGSPPPSGSGNPGSTVRGGLQLGPPGRWWDDKKFAKSLGLNGDQQKRMDAVFAQNRDALLSRYDAVQKAEARLESLTHVSKPSEAALFTEIDHVAQAHAELEKATTHYLLQIRDEMTPEQLGKLEDHR